MKSVDQLRAAFRVIIEEARANEEFAQKLSSALGGEVPSGGRPERRHRRSAGVLDPYAVFEDGESALRSRLAGLGVEELRDIIAEHGMDSTQLSRKWRTRERLEDLIVERVDSRIHKGDAFRK